MKVHLKRIRTIMCFCSRSARHLTLLTPSDTCRAKIHFSGSCDVASNQSRLEPGRLCSVGSPAAAMTVWNCGTAETRNRGRVVRAVSEVHWSQYQWRRRRLKCVVQQNGRHIVHLLKQLFSRITRHFCYSIAFSSFCKLHIYTHAVLWGATYRITVKSSKSYIRLFLINCCVSKNY